MSVDTSVRQRRSLEDTLREQGFDPEAIRQRRRLLEPSQLRAYLELHIEQGPRLVEEGLPAAVVTAIRVASAFATRAASANTGTLARCPVG